MTLSRKPDLWQFLPAEKRCDLEASPEFIATSQQLETLKRKPGSTEQDRRKVYAQKQKLVTAELRKC